MRNLESKLTQKNNVQNSFYTFDIVSYSSIPSSPINLPIIALNVIHPKPYSEFFWRIKYFELKISKKKYHIFDTPSLRLN